MLPIQIKLPDDYFAESAKTLVVSADTKKLWAVELDLLCELDRVCKKHGIKYTLAYGTLLGAARHHGFIPWDNDADVVMLREDYTKFCEVADREFYGRYFLQTDENTPEAGRGHAQLRNSETTAILKSEMVDRRPLYGFNQGVFIDIFPLDSVPDDESDRELFLECVNLAKERMRKIRGSLAYWKNRRYIKGGYRAKLKGLYYTMLKCICGIDALAKSFERCGKLETMYNGLGMSYCSPVSFSAVLSKRWRYRIEWFKDMVDLSFESMNFPVPARYEQVLDINYGDWHRHVIGGDCHGGVVFDPENSYTKYLSK